MGEDDIEGMRVGEDRANERLGEPGSERSSALAKLFETDELLDLDEFAGTVPLARAIGRRRRTGVARIALLG